jgi:hypothetical protein
VQARWTITYGPEFPGCKRRWKNYPARFDLHLASIRIGLERDPYRYSTPFLTENDRVLESDDFHDGFTMTAFVKVHPDRFISEIKWVELRRIEVEDDEADPQAS